MDLIKPNDPRLNFFSEAVSKEELTQGSFQKMIDEVISFAHGEQGNLQKTVMVGLAAPQVGILKRIILVDINADGKGHTGDLRIYLNPEIAWASQDTTEWYEGCYSTANVAGLVNRPSEVLIKAWDRFGNAISEKHTGYIARIFQHEIDHLNGIRFPMRIRNLHDLHLVEKDEFSSYRNQQKWRSWDKKCSWDQWLNVINLH